MTFDFDGDKITKAHPGTSNSIVIPSNFASIIDGDESEYAFIEFKSTKFSISFAADSKLTKIGSYSFYNCHNLTSIDFSNANSLKTICGYAFRFCYSLTSLHFPSSLESLNFYGAFANCYNIEEIHSGVVQWR